MLKASAAGSLRALLLVQRASEGLQSHHISRAMKTEMGHLQISRIKPLMQKGLVG